VSKVQTTIAISLGVVVLGIIWYVWRQGAGAIVRGTVNLANDAIGGAVVGLGDAVGIPETNVTECEQLLAAGRYWDASFKCPAGMLIKGVFGDTPAPAASSPTALADAPMI
jgi:hypothetical protein